MEDDRLAILERVAVPEPRREAAMAPEWIMPLPHPAGLHRVHRLTLGAVEGLAELVEVLH
jgi:hypothetical protein